MNSQEYRNLQEAYLDVYQELDEATAMAKRGLDEPAIRNKIASQTRGGEFADKAGKLADRETYGNTEKKAGRENLARKQRGTFRDTNSSSPGLRGYGHQSSDPAVKAKQDARGNQRARAALTPNERKQLNMESYDLFDYIMEYLITEGYADTNENALVIMANMSEDWRQSIVEVTGGGKVEYKPRFGGSSERPGPRVYPQTTQDPEKRGMSSYPSTKTADKINQLNYEKSKIPKESEKGKKLETRVSKLQSRFNRDGKEDQDYVSKEEVDLYDVILEYLITEGYADTNENALVIMANMSEDWRHSIVEEVIDEAYVDYRKGKLPSGRTPQQAAQGRSELLNARERNRPLGKLDGTYSRQQNQNRRTKEMDKLTTSNPVSRAVRRGLGDMLPGGQPSTDRHINAMDRRNRVADIASAEKKSRGR